MTKTTYIHNLNVIFQHLPIVNMKNVEVFKVRARFYAILAGGKVKQLSYHNS